MGVPGFGPVFKNPKVEPDSILEKGQVTDDLKKWRIK